MADRNDDRPWGMKLASWYSFVFAAVFLIYGGVEIILSFLDRNYAALMAPIIFTIIGLVLVSFAYAFKELRMWGWYGLIAINGLVVVFGSIGFSQHENVILAILSAATLVALFLQPTREYLSRHQ